MWTLNNHKNIDFSTAIITNYEEHIVLNFKAFWPHEYNIIDIYKIKSKKKSKISNIYKYTQNAQNLSRILEIWSWIIKISIICFYKFLNNNKIGKSLYENLFI